MLATVTTAQRAQEAADARALVAFVDALFVIAGAAYGVRRLKALPKTYISEIAFPLDVRHTLHSLTGCHTFLLIKRCTELTRACVLHYVTTGSSA